MKIKRIEFMEEITDVDNDNIDVLVENEDGYRRRDTTRFP